MHFNIILTWRRWWSSFNALKQHYYNKIQQSYEKHSKEKASKYAKVVTYGPKRELMLDKRDEGRGGSSCLWPHALHALKDHTGQWQEGSPSSHPEHPAKDEVLLQKKTPDFISHALIKIYPGRKIPPWVNRKQPHATLSCFRGELFPPWDCWSHQAC